MIGKEQFKENQDYELDEEFLMIYNMPDSEILK